ncbi:MAG: enoyl-CoA hydratase/isomerase family protein [Myxococcota bacterium]
MNLEVDEDPSGIVTLRLKREERRNALHGPLWTAIGETARALAPKKPRVVILTGSGGHFSAGMDLKPDNPLIARLFPALQGQDAEALRALIVELKGVVDAVASLPCPVIAAVDGACAGGGLELALAADLRVASRGAFFSMPEAQVGMMPDVGGTVRLMRLIGRARALELCLSGHRLDAEAALRLGLINRISETDQAVDAAQALAKGLLTAAPTATAEILRLIRDPAANFSLETEAGVRVLMSGEVIEGTSSFLERRPPRWSR